VKKLAILFVLIPFITFAQQKRFIEGAWGINFGTPANVAGHAAAAKGAVYDETDSKPNLLVFTKIIFAQRKVDTLQLSFFQDKMWRAVMTYPVYTSLKVMEEYRAIIKELSEVYRNPELIDNFLYPYKKEDDDNVYTITQGNADHRALWTVRSPEHSDDTIELQITRDLRFILTYTNGALKRQVDAKNMAIKSRDY
jgi:hypothetical protein